MIMNPPPPIFPASGCTTARAKPTATAASTALPPCCRMSRPTCLAIGLPDTTIALGASTTLALPRNGQLGAAPALGETPGVPRVPQADNRASRPTRAVAGDIRTEYSMELLGTSDGL